MDDRIAPRYETAPDRINHIEAPRFHRGTMIGYYPCSVVRVLNMDNGTAYLVRFDDGHEAGAFRSELRATAHGWSLIDALDD